MMPATRSLLARAAPAARWGTSIVLFVLLLGMLPSALTAPLGAAAPHGIPTSAAPQPAVVPAVACGNNGSDSENFGANNSAGQVPFPVQFNLTTVNLATPYQYSVDFGDGHYSNGTQSAACSWGVPLTVLFDHTYTWPAQFPVSVRLTGFNGGGGYIEYSFGVYAWGAAGYYPFNITSNVSRGTVPLAIQYNLTANSGVPAGLSYSWTVVNAEGVALSLNTTGFGGLGGTVLDRYPGWVTGSMTASYANGTVYDVAYLPNVYVAPVLNVSLAVSATSTGSPFHVTFWGNATNASGGGVPTVNYTDIWSFGDGSPAGVGSPVTHVYWNNNTVYWGPYITVQARDNAGNVLGANGTVLWLNNTTVGSSPPIRVNLTPHSPLSGPAPLSVNASVIATGGYAPYGLQMCVFNGSTAPPSTPTGYSPIWPDILGYSSSKISNWSGTAVGVVVNFSAAGQYVLAAYVNDGNISTPYAVTWVLVNVTGPVAPLALTTSVTPLNGTAPLNVSFVASASGGTAPYDLHIGIQNTTNTPVANVSNWNGASLTTVVTLNTSGNWTILGSVVDATGHVVFGSTYTIDVAAPAPAAPLVVTAAFVPLTSAGSDSFRFSASVVGGVAPYTLVWNFGDGASQPGSLAGTVDHTYTALGTYYPSLTVTDHSGRQVTRQLGALLVTTGPAPGVGPASPPSWAIVFVVTTILGSALAIAVVVRWATHRREGLNWVRPFEEPSDGRTRPPSAP